MTIRVALAIVVVLLATAGCAEPEREWLKVNQPYTADEFRRDVAACSRGRTLDESCMKSRGWVSVSPPKAEKPAEPVRAPTSPRYR
jgi:hypothetical protein